jgi:gamma-glutamylcyclotransferase
MQTVHYFAYGSNLLSARLLARCASARVVCVAHAPGWAVSFSKPGADGSGKAGLAQSDNACHPGVVYEIARQELPLLDWFEGVGKGYTRLDDFAGQLPDGSPLSLTTYMPIRHDATLKPYDWYLALCIAGAREQGLGDTVIGQFRAQAWLPDPDPLREGRRLALEALAAAGHDDWEALLRD